MRERRISTEVAILFGIQLRKTVVTLSHLREDIGRVLGFFPSRHQVAVMENASEALAVLRTCRYALANADMESRPEYDVLESFLCSIDYGSEPGPLEPLRSALRNVLGPVVDVPEVFRTMEASEAAYTVLKSVDAVFRDERIDTSARKQSAILLEKITQSVYEAQKSVVFDISQQMGLTSKRYDIPEEFGDL